MTNQLAVGDRVILLSKPDGCTSRFYPLTEGASYTVLDFNGSNVITTTDVAGEQANFWRGRVQKQTEVHQ